MDTADVAILAVAAVLIVTIVALVQLRTKVAEIEVEDRRESQREAARVEARDHREARDAATSHATGPADGAVVLVHVGPHDVQGTRVMRDDPAAEGWIVLKDAVALESGRPTPLGGKQWLRNSPWMQES